MHDSRAAAVTYLGLPISSGGAHSLGRMSRRVAYDRTLSFLRTCTQPVGPVEHSFNVHGLAGLLPLRHPEGELRRRFGRGRHVLVEQARVGDALDFLDDVDPQPTDEGGMAPIWFEASSKFRILDPLTGTPLPDQDPERFGGAEYEWQVPLGTSGLRLILENRARLAIELCIPKPDDDVLCRVVPWLQENLPCKLSPKHWRAWTPTRSGSFKSRRIPAP